MASHLRKGSRRRIPRERKGRQSSVHDLVDLWGGGVVHLKEKEKEKEKVVRHPTAGDYKSHASDTHKPLTRRPSFLPSSSNPRSASPQPISSPTVPRNSRPQRSTSQHRKLSSATATSNSQAPPTRGRPQSMFIFPVGNSKSDSSVATSCVSRIVSTRRSQRRKGHGAHPFLTWCSDTRLLEGSQRIQLFPLLPRCRNLLC
jgi:AP2-associated kinase